MRPGLAHHLDDAALRDFFGATTFVRGSSYAADGRVLEVSVDEVHQTVTGVVIGSEGRRYRTTVGLDAATYDLDLESYCTCPVGVDCKHAAALLIAARGSAGRRPGAERRPDWERSLSQVLEAATPSGDIPMALQFEVSRRQARRSPYSFAGPSLVPERRIRLRPVVPGATGAWVRTGVSWRQLRFNHDAVPYDAAHRAALRELLVTYEAGGLSPYGSYGGDVMFLDEFGPSLWRMLRQAADCGVALVPSRKRGVAVVLNPDPATAALDLTRHGPPDGASLIPRLLLDEQVLDLESVDQIGAPVHGLAVHQRDRLLLVALDRPLPNHLEQLVQHAEPLHIPESDLDRFVTDFYPRLRRIAAVGSADQSMDLPEIAAPALSLTLTYHEGHRVALGWGFDYRVGDATRTYPILGSAEARDAAAERELVAALPLPDDPQPWLRPDVSGVRRLTSPLILSGMDAVTFLDQWLPTMEAAGVVVHERGERPEFRESDQPPQVRIRATDSNDPDWFDLGVTVDVDGEEVPFDVLFAALSRGDDHLLLPSGTWFDLNHAELHQLGRLIEEARALLEAEPGELRLSRYQAGFWEELCSLGVVEEQAESWAEAVSGLVDADQVDPVPPPEGLVADLRPYQLDGFRWLSFLWDHGLGGVLADDMGLGKTVQTLALLCRAKEAGELTAPALVVAPTSVVRNWVNEAARFAPGLRVVSVRETEARRGRPLKDVVADADLVVTSYSLLRLEYDGYDALPWSGLMLDEAQFVKNHQAKTYQCARRLAAPFKLAITGTPLENNLMELWALLSIVAPGLFPSKQAFTEYFRKPIERGSDPDLLTALRRRVRPLMRRRTKELVAAELPPKQEQVLEVDLSPKHRKIYETNLQRERQKILGLLDDLDAHRFTILKSLTLLRQLSLDPALVDDAHAGVGSAKLDVLVEHLSELSAEGHRALVFSQFTGFLRRVRQRLDHAGLGYCYLDGGTRNRDAVIAEFKEGNAPVFLISLKAGGFGLNLTEADYCFILDPWWNPATEAQAVDRTHRIGQDKHVVVYRLVSSDTIEEKVMALKARKAELFGSVMGDDGMLSGPLSAADIKGLVER